MHASRVRQDSMPHGKFRCKDLEWVPFVAKEEPAHARRYEVAYIEKSRLEDLYTGEGKGVQLNAKSKLGRRDKEDGGVASIIAFTCKCGPEIYDPLSPRNQAEKAYAEREAALAEDRKRKPTGSKRVTGRSQKVGCGFAFAVREFKGDPEIVEIRRVAHETARTHNDACTRRNQMCYGEGISAEVKNMLRSLCMEDPSMTAHVAQEKVRTCILEEIVADGRAEDVEDARAKIYKSEIVAPRDYYIQNKDIQAVRKEVKEWRWKRAEGEVESIALHHEADKEKVEEHRKIVFYQPQKKATEWDAEKERTVDVEKEPFVMVLQSASQRPVLIEHGAVVQIDSTFGTNDKHFSFFTLLVMAPIYEGGGRRGIPAAFFITSNEEKDTIALALTEIKKKCKGWAPTTFVSDVSLAQIGGIKGVFGESVTVLLCLWHVKRAWVKNLLIKVTGGDVKTKELRAKVMDELNALVKWRPSSGGKEVANEAKEKCDDFQRFLGKHRELEAFALYFSNFWVDFRESFMKAFRMFDHHGTDTNAAIESYHGVMKPNFFTFKRLLGARVDSLVYTIIEKMIPHYDHMISEMKVGLAPRSAKDYGVWVKVIKEGYAIVEKDVGVLEEEEDSFHITIRREKNNAEDEEEKTYDVHVTGRRQTATSGEFITSLKCDCPQGVRGLPCACKVCFCVFFFLDFFLVFSRGRKKSTKVSLKFF